MRPGFLRRVSRILANADCRRVSFPERSYNHSRYLAGAGEKFARPFLPMAMILGAISGWISAASLLVPCKLRAEWKQEWLAELRHRAELGTRHRELWRHARSCFRDAWILRKRNPVAGPFSEPFRAEIWLFCLVSLCFVLAGGFRKPPVPYPNAERVVFFRRGVGFFAAGRAAVTYGLAEQLHSVPEFQTVASYRFVANPGDGLEVSSNFFDVLGVHVWKGRGFDQSESGRTVVLSDEFWRKKFGADDAILGKDIELGTREYTVVGILPRDFRFLERQFFTLLPYGARMVGAIALLKPEASLAAAQNSVWQLTRVADPGWHDQALQVVPAMDYGWRHPLELLGFLFVSAMLFSALFLTFQAAVDWKHYLFLAVRLALVLPALVAGWILVNRFAAGSAFQFWIFLLVCFTTVLLIVRDHQLRCPKCLGRLRMPVPLGEWSSPVLDPPGTEYVCPKGHGVLYVNELGIARKRWTALDDSWRDLFANATRS